MKTRGAANLIIFSLLGLGLVGVKTELTTHYALPALPYLKYLSYYTDDPLKYGYNLTHRGSSNMGPPMMTDLPTIANLYNEISLPMLYMPGGPMRENRSPPSRGTWYHCGCQSNTSEPGVCFVPGWQDAFLEQAAALVPFILNGTIFGIFFGDEISCSCAVPFAVFEEATSFFRGALSANLGLGHEHDVFYATNECFSTFACGVPPNCGNLCPNCFNKMAPGYWPSIPSALDYVSMDAYVGDGVVEPNFIRQFYISYVYPKLSPDQNVWVVPGLAGPLTDETTPAIPPYQNDTLFLEKMQGYATWTLEDDRVQGWLPWLPLFILYIYLFIPAPSLPSYFSCSCR